MEKFDSMFSHIKSLNQELQDYLCRAQSTSCYTYEPEPRNTIVERITVSHSTSITSARDSYSFQKKKNGITVPQKHVGLIEVLPQHYGELTELVNELNKTKLDFKRQLPKAISSRHDRRNYIDSLCEDVITSTIYRKVLIAPRGTYRSSISWTVNQKAPNPISVDEALSLISKHLEPYDGETLNSFNMRHEKAVAQVRAVKSNEMLIRLQDIRVHPGQTLKVRNSVSGTKPYYYNPSTPIIYVDDSDTKGFKEGGLSHFDLEQHSKQHRTTKQPSKLKIVIKSLGLYCTDKK
ncbi:DNA replication terminus site-binding protein [Vibrio agarivorans]|uniref:DNA replication terminus site-binding protein n=1 Tax=Vibrio agarivorans TaxID=153622 RepID=A0ABT7Y836_9VIBR|nr:DNA replication terminus site-binding protein [Vibrio agarivorans]MDN2483919.1 DNA replication terminus site-binding protein [Vibrio agarivorans]